MKALILAGGKGERFGTVQWVLPKSLVPFKGKPLLQHIIEDYCAHPDVDEVIILCGRNRQIRNFVNQRKFSKPVSVCTSDRGVFGDILQVKDRIGNQPFFVGTADNLVSAAFPRRRDFEKSGTVCLMAITTARSQAEYTGIETRENSVTGIFENPRKSSQGFGVVGKMLFHPSVLELIKRQNFPKRAPIGFLLVYLHQQNLPLATAFVNPHKIIHVTRFTDWWKKVNYRNAIKGAYLAVRTRIPKRRPKK